MSHRDTVWAARLPRGKRAGIGVAVAESWVVDMVTGRRELNGWHVVIQAKGRREFAAFLPRCRCERRYVCTLAHSKMTSGFNHFAQFCHAMAAGFGAGYHFEHVAVYVGKVLATYGCSGVRRPRFLPTRSIDEAVGRVAA